VADPLFVLSPATESDYTWLWEVKRMTMKSYVEQTWGLWDEKLQSDFFRANFSPATVQIILLDGQRAGLLQLEDEGTELFLANIQIHPDFQNRGLGTAVVRTVLESGHTLRRPVRLQVLKVNAAAQQLYLRLGFTAYGETLTHVLMRWRF
jgi:ribosomal protein S18 acetylase RimI-like enzyme